MGGKHSIGKELALFMSDKCPPNTVCGYMEPFCGSLGVFHQMADKGYETYIAADLHPDLISMWENIDNLTIPEEISKEEYYELKRAASPNPLRAVAGFGISFGGKFFGGYAQTKPGSTYCYQNSRDYMRAFSKSIKKMVPKIKRSNVHFYCKSYKEWKPSNMLIYCDPPYGSTTGYSTGDFNNEEFWQIMREWSKTNTVFISEFNAPPDFVCVWEKQKWSSLTSNLSSRCFKKERLFCYIAD